MSDESIPKEVTPKLALTRVEAAEALGVSAVTVDRLAQRGLLRPSRANCRPLYSVKEIDLALKCKADFEADPKQHTYQEVETP